MGIFDRFRFKGKDSKPPKSGLTKKDENVLDMVKDVSEKPKKPAVLKSSTGNAFKVLLRPLFSEKATSLARSGKYVFMVHPDANKSEVKKAVEKVYDVAVTGVNMVNLSGKARRYGRLVGRTVAKKKAIVTLRAGQKIEGLIDVI